jgi:hypothetical protein
MSTGRIIGIILIVGGLLVSVVGFATNFSSLQSAQSVGLSGYSEQQAILYTQIFGWAAVILGIVFAAKSKKTKE